MRNTPDWNADAYGRHGRFISRMGLELLGWLAPRAGETILDAGCGDGFITEHIARSGAHVLGIDASEDMVAAAQSRGLDAQRMDIGGMEFAERFDAVFSNSVLQWIAEPTPAISAMAGCLKPGGRLVADLGALGNLAAALTALRAVGEKHGGDPVLANPFYAPTGEEFSALLQGNGFTIEKLEVQPRITPVETSLLNWIVTIFHPFFDQFEASERTRIGREVETLLKPVLCDRKGQWYADHVRLRVLAVRSGSVEPKETGDEPQFRSLK